MGPSSSGLGALTYRRRGGAASAPPPPPPTGHQRPRPPPRRDPSGPTRRGSRGHAPRSTPARGPAGPPRPRTPAHHPPLRAVADRKVPAAGWIGAIAGNAPDWSELLVSPGAWGGAPGSAPAYLVYHRGITHSFVGAVIEIVVLTGLVGLILTWRTRADAGALPPWRWIAVCVAPAVP